MKRFGIALPFAIGAYVAAGCSGEPLRADG